MKHEKNRKLQQINRDIKKDKYKELKNITTYSDSVSGQKREDGGKNQSTGSQNKRKCPV